MLNKVVTVMLSSFLLISCGGGGSGGGTSSNSGTTSSTSNSSSTSESSSSSSESSSSSSVPTPILPVANAGEDQLVKGGHAVMLSGAASSGEAGRGLSYTWSIPEGIEAFFLNELGALTHEGNTQDISIYIPANHAGKTLTFSLVVSDGLHTSEADTVNITIEDCPHDAGNVFLDCIDPSWSGITAWQTISDRDDNTYYNNGIDNHVTWSIVDLQDGYHNNVIDIEFHRSDANGNFSISALVPEGADIPAIDMTEFTDGYLKFDVRNVGSDDPLWLAWDLQCGYPCNIASPQAITTEADQEWKTISIRVQDLVTLGLDLSKVSTAIIINPMWGMQAGGHFQLDNIRWEK